MLLQLENTNGDNLKKLLEFAGKLNLRLKVVEADEGNTSLPGKPLSESALKAMIESSRKSGSITMNDAHDIIRKNFNAG